MAEFVEHARDGDVHVLRIANPPANTLRTEVRAGLLDGIAAGVPQAELLARARYPKPTCGSYALPGKRELVNVDAAVVKRYS
jgi:hypothetical protein